MNEDQLFRFLDKTCGTEVSDVIKYEIQGKKKDNNMVECTGECDHTYAIAEEYQALLREITYTVEELLDVKSVQSSKKVSDKLEYILREIEKNT